ncbi:primosomal protein N' [Candidatus Saccharibacteria bacterium]|nr:primosomal protein N' [Candidatus Saccharibacteria bacterium]
MFYEVIPTRVFRSGSTTLTYFSDSPLSPGQVVLIPLGKSSCPGIVLKKVKKPSFPCKPIKNILYKTPLPSYLLKSALWLSSYYLSPLPQVASMILPIGVEKRRRKLPNLKLFQEEKQATTNQTDDIKLNPAQLSALKSIQATESPTRLLFGVTGSGKTNIYLKLAEETLNREQSVILLVPEIALTSQLVQIFSATFQKSITLIHSKQTESERHQIWENLLLEKTPQIIIGPRSALFAPVKNLGLIIIDEAHESAYYQENTPKYSSLRLASFLASSLKIPCVMGTATPLVSDFYLAKAKNSLITLDKKAKDTAISPDIKIIDFTSRDSFLKSRYFSNELLKTIATNLKNGHQTLIYHNRRGSAPMTICENCGWQALCPNCFLPLTLHSDSYSLICHTCGYTQKIPSSCPECRHPSILHKGFGTKLLESELKKLFKDAKIIRFDADSKKNETLDSLFTEVKRGDYNIIIGTQTVSRGLDLPLLASIGIVQADAGLSLPDFSAEERTYELLTQVIGRVGRGHLKTASVIIQTYKPTSPIITFATNADYLGFYNFLIKKRKKQLLPPFVYLAKVSVTYKTERTTLSKIRSISKNLFASLEENSLEKSVKISPPMPCFHERTSTGFSWQLIIKSTSRANLVKLLSSIDPKLGAKIALDPPSLL